MTSPAASTNTNYYYFSEQPYTAYDPAIQEEHPALRLMLPNCLFDPQVASDLYNRYHDEYQVADESGFDGIMINEHHTAPFCMQASITITGAVLAKITKNVKILMLGAPLPVVDNPLRLSEELAMIDCISRGRLISGVVRGGGVESLANNVNPAYNRERFEEAHDLIIAAWTRPGPFRWEGKHFEYRVVNPWVLPLQKPHPPIMVPGTASPETVIWAAQHRYPYVVLGSSMAQTQELISLYRDTAAECGYEMGPEHIGYLIRVFVADTEEKAQAEGHNFFWQNGALNKQPREWMAPPGYASIDFAGIRRLRAVSKPFDSQAYQEAQDNYQVVLGTPDQVIEKLRYVRDTLGIGHMCLWAQDGYMSHQDTVRCIELFGNEVLPALRDS
ncbi:MAG TPA: LLM class flavin-dependent oxidoreductase [Chloroflexota bacterium]|jgi:alkanesulfonate monooxygenase SsuD/methylene tetrahydromethanopterin reductase-like flavin-dependent oxidoreductase (luciferase family)